MSSVLLAGPAARASPRSAPPGVTPPASAAPPAGGPRGNAVTIIAAVGVLLLAMGVGVLIGRSGSSKPVNAPAQVITVGGTAAGASTTPAESAASFTDDWPAGSSGYTVQLQTLPLTGTQVSAVEAAKAAASAKGASAVGALKSEDFSSLAPGSFVIYSGDYHKRAQAVKARAKLLSKFPAAKVIRVSSGASAAGSSGGPTGASGAGSSESHPAPPTVLKNLKKGKSTKSYEEQSKKLPDVISTG